MAENLFSWANVQDVSVNVVTLGLAPVIRRRILNKARHKAQESIQAFRQSTYTQVKYARLNTGQLKAITDFSNLAKEAELLNQEARKEGGKFKIPASGSNQSLKKSDAQLEVMANAMKSVIEKADKQNLFKSFVAHEGVELLKKNAAMGMGLTIASLPLMEDLTTVITGHDVVGDDLLHDLFSPDDLLTGLASVPGLFSGARALFKETKMLANGETSFGDSLWNGILPAAGRMTLQAIGTSIDIAFGGSTLGLGTLIGWAAGKLLQRQNPKDSIENDMKELKPYLNRVVDQNTIGIRNINSCIHDNFKSFPNLFQSIPVFGSIAKPKQFVADLAKAKFQDSAAVYKKVEDSCAEIIEKLPARGWKDKLFNIDSRTAVAELFTQERDTIFQEMKKANYDFLEMTQDHNLSMLAQYMSQQEFTANGQVMTVLENLPGALPEMAVQYRATLAVWKKACEEMWSQGTEKVTNTTKKQEAALGEVKKQVRPNVREIQERIHANMRRLSVSAEKRPDFMAMVA